jgi:hypothetical protein
MMSMLWTRYSFETAGRRKQPKSKKVMTVVVAVLIFYLTSAASAQHCPAAELPPRGISQITLRKGCSFTDAMIHPALGNPYFTQQGIIIDVGANDGKNLAVPSIGQRTGARVISFEPQPEVADDLFRVASVKAGHVPPDERPVVHKLPLAAGSLPTLEAVEKAAKLLMDSSAGGLVVIAAAAGDSVSSFPIFSAKDSGTKMTSLAPRNMPKGKGGARSKPQQVTTVRHEG